MAAIEKYVTDLSCLFRRLFRKYKFLNTCRMYPLIDTLVDPGYSCSCSIERLNIDFNNCDRLNFIAVKNESTGLTKRRNFFSFAPTHRSKEFLGRKLVGFSMEEMFEVVSDVDKYKEFLPFCKKSIITMQTKDKMRADLVIGFPPVVERYTSHIRYVRPNYILAESRDATLFNHLATNWKFSPGLSNNPRTCVINFQVAFEFKSVLHSQLANMFFNELVKQMESAFYTEATRRFGAATVPTIELKVSPNSSS